jgi:hypothetical protein
MFFKFKDCSGVEKAIPREDVRLISFFKGVVEVTYWYKPTESYITEKVKDTFSVLVKRINTF